MTLIWVDSIVIPPGSTLGYGEGHDKDWYYTFVGDHRAMRRIGEAIQAGEHPQINIDEALAIGERYGRPNSAVEVSAVSLPKLLQQNGVLQLRSPEDEAGIT
jgi:hypothetical protein